MSGKYCRMQEYEVKSSKGRKAYRSRRCRKTANQADDDAVNCGVGASSRCVRKYDNFEKAEAKRAASRSRRQSGKRSGKQSRRSAPKDMKSYYAPGNMSMRGGASGCAGFPEADCKKYDPPCQWRSGSKRQNCGARAGYGSYSKEQVLAFPRGESASRMAPAPAPRQYPSQTRAALAQEYGSKVKIGKDGSFCAGQTEKNCTGTPVLAKTCVWDKRGFCKKRSDVNISKLRGTVKYPSNSYESSGSESD